MDIAKIGKFLRKSRRRWGLTQGDVAEFLGVSAQAVSKWERGENLPDMAFLPDISKLLEVGIDEILDAGRISDEGEAQETGTIQKLVDEDLFEKILNRLRQIKNVEEMEMGLDFFVYLGARQKSDTIEAILAMKDYQLALDEILPYSNTAHRNAIVDHILAKCHYDLLEQLSTYMSNEMKAAALTKLLNEGRYDIIEDNITTFNRKHRDLIVQHFETNTPDIEIIENFIPFFDKNQRQRLSENIKIEEEEQ
ncbi:MAG: helix-turn-helix domain-containing protein [Defluviitaleaceae bacterium]|nr:helix-turn-helix domain-containing protein [Defluviitaleaceae bacterium]